MFAMLLLPLLGLGLVTALSSFEEEIGDILDEGAEDLIDDIDVQDIARVFGLEELFGGEDEDTLDDEGDDAGDDAGDDTTDGETDGDTGDDVTDDDNSNEAGDEQTDGDPGSEADDDASDDDPAEPHTCGNDDGEGGEEVVDMDPVEEEPVSDGEACGDWPKDKEAGRGNCDDAEDEPVVAEDPAREEPETEVGVLLEGDAEDNLLTGGEGNDTLRGAAGDDVLEGNGGSDVLEAGLGTDVLTGGDGDDVLTGFDLPLSDTVDAGSGDTAADALDGGAGNDTLTGNDGDVIITGDGEDVVRALGLDQIGQSAVIVTDFDPAEDVLVLVDRQGNDVDFASDSTEDGVDPDTIVEIRAASDGAGTEVIYDDRVIALLQGTEIDALQSQTAWLANRDALVLVQLATST